MKREWHTGSADHQTSQGIDCGPSCVLDQVDFCDIDAKLLKKVDPSIHAGNDREVAARYR